MTAAQWRSWSVVLSGGGQRGGVGWGGARKVYTSSSDSGWPAMPGAAGDHRRFFPPTQPVGSAAMRIDGAVALVTGGASGLGEAAVRRLAAAGASVTICDLDHERGQALARQLGPTTQFVACDVTDPELVAAAVAAATTEMPLRINVNCAGIGDAVRTVSRNGTPHDHDRFVRVININLVGTFNTMVHSAVAMAAAEPQADGERGVIINTASIAAYDGQIGQVAYAASKGGVVAMTLPAARDLSSSGIRVCAIAPGLMDTPLLGLLPEAARQALRAEVPFPKRLGLPVDYAELAAHVIENRYLNGEVIRLDGALRMPPR
jgi:NAD(P)-dependent dehydrogenase (short-subunit alcohol dehydrogenase family)